MSLEDFQNPKKPWERIMVEPAAIRRLGVFSALRFVDPAILRELNLFFLNYQFDVDTMRAARAGLEVARERAINGLVNDMVTKLIALVDESGAYLRLDDIKRIIEHVRPAAERRYLRDLLLFRPATDEELASYVEPIDVTGLADTIPRETPSVEAVLFSEEEMVRKAPRMDWPQDDDIMLITPKQFRKLSRKFDKLLKTEPKTKLVLNELERLTWIIGRWLELRQSGEEGGSLGA